MMVPRKQQTNCCGEDFGSILPKPLAFTGFLFMIFYVQNIGNYHWVLDIAVNPYCMLLMITSATTKESQKMYGFMRIDPLEDKFCEGTIPSLSVYFPQDSQLHVRNLVFLLNFMSCYRDLCIHDLLEDYVPVYTTDYFWVMGTAEPFGREFEENDKESAPFIWKHYSWSYFPQLKTQPNTLPVQCDGYNCGIFVVYNIMDLVLTQWDKVWVISDLVVARLEASSSNALATWTDIIGLCKFAQLPNWYSIGTAFVPDPSSANKTVYKTICDFM
jgi:hypothetical protein